MAVHLGPHLPDLVRDLSNSLGRALDHVVSTKALLAQSLTISVSVLFETYTQLKIAVDQVDAHVPPEGSEDEPTPGLGDAWMFCVAGQEATLAQDWTTARAACVALMSGIWGVLPKSADNSPLLYQPNDGSQNNVLRVMTVTTQQRTAYNNLADTLAATIVKG